MSQPVTQKLSLRRNQEIKNEEYRRLYYPPKLPQGRADVGKRWLGLLLALSAI